ncbi:MAG: hypothetical protein NVS9B10_12270 [Nevskia sp.]
MNRKMMSTALVSAMSLLPALGLADPLETLPYAFSGGTPSVDLRLRYENVDQKNALHNAYATTFRARIGYDTGKWNDFDIFGEYEGTSAFFNQDYNSTVNGKINHSVVADPQNTRLNQAFIRYAGLPKTVIKLGRQRIKLDNDRFIGNVGWRDAEQTYDGYNLVTSWLLPKSTLNYTYISNVNNIFYTDFSIRGHLINASYAYAPWLKLTGYAYLLDFKQNVAARRDTETFGGRITGSLPIDAVTLSYTGEYAKQQRYADSPSSVDAKYYFVEPVVTWKFLTAKAGYEVLSSNAKGTYGFQTPLATLHVFQGWADLFLNTPATGIRDLYGSLGATVEKVSMTAVYHDFEADTDGRHYGDEIDLLVSRPVIKGLVALVKYADYSADRFAVDTKKFWVELDYQF